ncbi:TPA: YfcE family phosphodiesterase [Streptococcus suis]
MKWLLLSDNHGRWQAVNDLVDKYRHEVGAIFHCGDSEFPFDDPIWDKIDYVVAGNMDFDPQFAKQAEVETPEGRVFLVHGHRHGVNLDNQELLGLAKEKGYQFVFHGHTHRLYAEMRDGILFVNPGSFNHSRGPIDQRTYAILTFGEGTLRVDFFDESHQVIPGISQTFGWPL